MDDLAIFRWFDSTAEWMEARAFREPDSTPREWWLVSHPDEVSTVYQPLRDELALFREFADVPPSREAIARFAHQYGTLEVDTKAIVVSGQLHQGEPFKTWWRELRAMRLALDVWDAVREKEQWGPSGGVGDDDHQLDEWIKPDYNDDGWLIRARFARMEEGHKWGGVIVDETERPELLHFARKVSREEVVPLVARFYIQATINERLQEHTCHRLLYNPDSQQQELHLVPENLLGALWLQFAKAVEGKRNYRRCLVCQEWFEVSPFGKRRQTKYCSQRCKQKAYYQRQTEASRMRLGGESFEAIAEKLGSNVKTVRGWIAKSERGKSK